MPAPKVLGDHFRLIVRVEIRRHTIRRHSLGQDINDVVAAYLPIDMHSKATAGELINEHKVFRTRPSCVLSMTKPQLQT